MLKFGYKASAEQFAPGELLKFAVEAENCGFESVWVSDHFQPWRDTGGHAPNAPIWMAALAASTSKVQIGTSVLTPTLRYHPSIVAQMFATMGDMYPGRIALGVGSGESLNEVPATGAAWPGFKERSGRLRESIELIRKLWTENRVTFDGQYYKTVSATLYDKPKQPVPIYLAATGPSVSKMAGEIADGFICTSGKAPELYRDTLVGGVEEGLATAGRPAGSMDRMIEMKVSFDTDIERALDDTLLWAALALSAEEKTGIEDPMEMERAAAKLPRERTASRWIVSTDPEEQVERIRPYVELGFKHLVFHAPGLDQIRFLKLYSEKVLPALRKAFD